MSKEYRRQELYCTKRFHFTREFKSYFASFKLGEKDLAISVHQRTYNSLCDSDTLLCEGETAKIFQQIGLKAIREMIAVHSACISAPNCSRSVPQNRCS